MTTNRSFKRLVRARMDKTGERYAAARAALLGGAEAHTPTAAAALATSDQAIRERTGRGWEEWFDLLDAWGADNRSHRDIARHLAGILSLQPLAWDVQAVTGSYERVRGLRAVGQRPDGFAVTASRTVAAPPAVAFDAVTDPVRRRSWLPDVDLRPRAATPPRRAGFDWGDGPTRVNVMVDALDDGRSRVTVEHSRMADAEERAARGDFWRAQLGVLADLLSGGDPDA